ncbi:hypothetical protein N7488_005943 [Penicillium malachiteum]|nr:hypothetical protein N7488_005943 [Penicillium malachiteum]
MTRQWHKQRTSIEDAKILDACDKKFVYSHILVTIGQRYTRSRLGVIISEHVITFEQHVPMVWVTACQNCRFGKLVGFAGRLSQVTVLVMCEWIKSTGFTPFVSGLYSNSAASIAFLEWAFPRCRRCRNLTTKPDLLWTATEIVPPYGALTESTMTVTAS